MARKTMDTWLERFNRETGIKGSIILSGNTSDIMLNQNEGGKYEPVMNSIIGSLKDKGFKRIIKWDSVDGIDYEISQNISRELNRNSGTYDMGDDFEFEDDHNIPKYASAGEFFPYLLKQVRRPEEKSVFILDYSDYIFGSPNSLPETERSYLSMLGKALQESQNYNLLDEKFYEVSSLIVIVTQKSSTIPPIYYLDNPAVSTINVPMPGRTERERFVDSNISCLLLSQDLRQDVTLKSDFIDALDDFSLKEIAQIMKLSRQIQGGHVTFEKLINLYKYGEKVSPWEELSRDKLEQVEQRLSERVKGQEDALRKVKDVIIRAYTGFSGLQHSVKQRKPKGTLFFVGPTGVGKTELAKSLAEFIFGDENACIRFDMSEFNHEHSDQRLVGAPPGYVGYEAGGQLTNAVKEKPFCVLLFDEIEKAHGKILDKFLQILEDGRLTDGKGETVFFSEAIIIFTSNLGATGADPTAERKNNKEYFKGFVKDHFLKELKRPELLNRMGDNIVVFDFIENPDVLKQIARAKFKSVEIFVKERYRANIEFENEDVIFNAIAKEAGVSNGGRGVLNKMEETLVNPLSNFIFERIDRLSARRILIKSMIPNKPDMAIFDFELI